MAVNIRIVSDFDNKGLKRAESSLSNFAGNAAKQVAKIGAAFAAAGAVAGARLGTDAVRAASDLGESINAVNVAFGEASSGVLKLGETSAQAMGVSQEAFNNAAVRFSAFAERVVGEGGDVAGFIGDVSQRATDFASVFNIDVAEALQVFQSGLAGEAEPLKRFGINLLQSEVAAYAMANGIAESSAEMTEAQKVQARYGLLMEQTAKTQGDFANTSDGLANRQRILQASFQDLQAEIGEALIPVAEQLFDVFQDEILPALQDFGEWIQSDDGEQAVENFVQTIKDSVETLKEFGDWFQENLPEIQRFGEIFLTVVGSVAAYTAGVKLATAATVIFNTAFRLTPWGLAVTAIGGTIAAIQFFSEETSTARTELEKLNGELSDTEVHEIHKKALAAVEDETDVYTMGVQDARFETEKFNEWQLRAVEGNEAYATAIENLYSPMNTQAQLTADLRNRNVETYLSQLDLNAALAEFKLLASTAVDTTTLEGVLEASGGRGMGGGRVGWDAQSYLEGLGLLPDETQQTAINTEIGDFAEETAEQLAQTLNDQIETALGNLDGLSAGLAELFDNSAALGATEQELSTYFDTLISGLEQTLSAEEFASIGASMQSFLDNNISTLERYAQRRDALLQDRDFASELIFGTAEAITAAGNINSLIDDTLTKTKEIDVSEVIEGVVDSADGLRGFKTTITKNYTEVIEETASAADNLTSNFRGVVERTKTFLDNLEELKKLGLDPMLFNQLVEAGVEAGGATAQALVDGGADTVNEVNALQTELEELGVDIGEETYDTMKNAGEQFTSGIVDGINANLDSIEVSAESAAEMFAQAFEEELQRLLGNLQLPTIGGGGGGGAGAIPRPGDFAPGAETTFDGQDIFKIRNPVAGQSLADIASQYGVGYDAIVDANPKFFDKSHKDYKAGYQGGEYLYDNTLINVPQLADGGIAMNQVLAMIGEQGPEAVIPLNKLDRMMNGGGNNYYINVTANTRAGGAVAGEEIVKALKAYQRQNGPIDRELTGFGA